MAAYVSLVLGIAVNRFFFCLLNEIFFQLNNLDFQARAGTLAIEDMDGGTFTISNGGVFGSLYGTPIINPPQSAILGMHGIFDRPVAVKGQVRVFLVRVLVLSLCVGG